MCLMLATAFPRSRWGAILLFLAATTAAQCNVTWLYPPAGLTFNYNDTVFASWTSDCPQPDLLVWGPSSDNSAQVLWDQSAVTTNGTAAFSFVNGIRFRSVWPFPAHFEIEYNDTADYYGVDGAVFSITSTTGEPTTYALSTTFVAPTTPTTFGTATAAGVSTTNSPSVASPATPLGFTASASSPSPSSASNATSDGITFVGDPPQGIGKRVGFGVGFGGGIVLLLVGLWAYNRWSKKKKARYELEHGQSAQDVAERDTVPGEKQERHEMQSSQEPNELASESTPYEVHGISRVDDERAARDKSVLK